MCFRQRQTKPTEAKAIWKDSIIIRKAKRGPRRIMKLLQGQGNNEQSLMCCLPRQFPARKQIHAETRVQIFEIQNILSKTTVSGWSRDTRSRAFLGTPDSHAPHRGSFWQRSQQGTHPCLRSVPPGLRIAYAAHEETAFGLKPDCRCSLSFTRDISKQFATQNYLPVCIWLLNRA